jgi:hypothetical protein
LRLKIGEHEIPERYLKSVVLYPDSSSVLFAGVLLGEPGRKAATGLRILAETRAIPFEVVDGKGVSYTGLCDIKNLKLVGVGTPRIKFSSMLVRPFRD